MNLYQKQQIFLPQNTVRKSFHINSEHPKSLKKLLLTVKLFQYNQSTQQQKILFITATNSNSNLSNKDTMPDYLMSI